MKNSEQAIEKVLSGLRNADASPGMERRILKALQDQAEAQSLSIWRRLRPLWIEVHPRAVAVSAACAASLAAALILVLIPAIHRPSQTPARANTNNAPLQPQAHAPSAAIAETVPPPTPQAFARRMAKPRAQKAPAVSTGDSLAESELHAASLPEPPMPLTEQEMLLLRIAHTGDPVELAALDPITWAARNAEEKAEFERFFEPKKTPATGDNK